MSAKFFEWDVKPQTNKHTPEKVLTVIKRLLAKTGEFKGALIKRFGKFSKSIVTSIV